MCKDCERKLKNLGGLSKRHNGIVKVFSRKMLKGQAVPFFCDIKINLGIEAEIYKIERHNTNRKIYNRNKLVKFEE